MPTTPLTFPIIINLSNRTTVETASALQQRTQDAAQQFAYNAEGAAILRESIRILQEDGWIAGSLVKLSGASCALGAVSRAASPGVAFDAVQYPSALNLNGPVDAALTALADARPDEYMDDLAWEGGPTRREQERTLDEQERKYTANPVPAADVLESRVYCYNDSHKDSTAEDRAESVKSITAWFERAASALEA